MPWLRAVRTTQERRENQFVLSEWGDYDGIPFRGIRKCRTLRNLVTAWDDIPVSSNWDRNWKKYRLTQYKPIVHRVKRDPKRYAKAMKRRDHSHLDIKYLRWKWHMLTRDYG